MPRINQTAPINLQLWDRAQNKYVTATVRLPSGQEIGGSPVPLEHIDGGFYSTQAVRMPQADFLTVFYEVFDDQGHTIPSAEHSEAFETITLTESGGGGGSGLQDDLIAEVFDADVELVGVVEDASVMRGLI